MGETKFVRPSLQTLGTELGTLGFSACPTTVAIFASRSHAAQHISDDDVCTRVRVRSSHIPASG